MKAESPEHVIDLFTEALNGGDVDGALALYEADATFAPQPGEEVKGHAAIRAALDQFMALRPRMDGEITKVITAGGVGRRTGLRSSMQSPLTDSNRRPPPYHGGFALREGDRETALVCRISCYRGIFVASGTPPSMSPDGP